MIDHTSQSSSKTENNGGNSATPHQPTTSVGLSDQTTCYMAGPIHRVDEATATTWRNNLKESSYSDIEFIDPLDVHDSTEDVQIVRDGFEASAERLYDDDATIVTDSEVVTTDLSLIDECDALIAYWPKGVDFTGTKMEVFYAAHNGLTTAAVFDHIHEIGPWFHHHIDYVDFDFDGAVAYLRQRT